MRHALQIVISLGQVYGDVLYYATSLLEISYCRPEGYYFWFYYFFFNFIWMVIGCCTYSSLAWIGIANDSRLHQAKLYRDLEGF